MRTRTHRFFSFATLLGLCLCAVGAFEVVTPMDAHATPITQAEVAEAEAVDVPDTPANPAGALVSAFLALAGVVGVGIMKGNLGGFRLETQEVRGGSHQGPLVSALVADGVGDLEVGEVVGYDGDGEGARLRPAVLDGVEVGVGDGAKKTFTFSFGSALEPRTVLVSDADGAEFRDDGSGRLYGASGDGTVNYATGETKVVYTNAPANNVAVTARAARELGGPITQPYAEQLEDAALYLDHGTGVEAVAHVGGEPVPTWLNRALRRRGVYLG